MSFRRARAGSNQIEPKKKRPEDDLRPARDAAGAAAKLAPVGQKAGIGGMTQLLDAKAATPRRARPQGQVFDKGAVGAAMHQMGGPDAKAAPPRRPRPQGQLFDKGALGAAMHDMGGPVAQDPDLRDPDLNAAIQDPDLRDPILDADTPDPAADAQAQQPDAAVGIPDKLPTYVGTKPGSPEWNAVTSAWGAIYGPLRGTPEGDKISQLAKDDTAAAHAWWKANNAPDRPERRAPAKRGTDKGPSDAEQDLVAKMMDENPELLKQMTIAKAQERYLDDALGGYGSRARQSTPLLHLRNPKDKVKELDSVKENMATQAAADVPGQAAPVNFGDAASLMRAYGLTEAEYVAIRTYSDGDFKYINPAVAFAKRKRGDDKKGWMEAQMGSEKKSLFEEGGLQAGIMMQGLDKLPRMAGPTWRGLRASKTQLDDWFAVGKLTKTAQFQSTSRKRITAEDFATGAHGNPDADQTVHVVCKLAINNAVDIKPFSKNAKEDEWLLLPATEFKVVSRKQLPTGPPGAPAATEWWEVSMVQTGPPIRRGNARMFKADGT